MLSLSKCLLRFSAVLLGRPEPSELLRRMGRFWLRNRSSSARNCEFSCSSSATRSWPACRALLAERVVICGLSSGFAASGLAWAGLAAGERKKVLIVLDLGSRRLACAKLPVNYRLRCRKLRRARSAAVEGLRSVPAAARACANQPKSHYWFQARGQLASCKTLASKRFVLRRTSAPPRRRSHAYLAPTRHCTAGGCFQSACSCAGQDHSTQAKSTQGAQLELSIHCHFDDFCKLQQSTSRNRGAQRAVAQLQAGCTARRRRDAKQR